jgi:peptide/nickel transport system substrate-binding protein
MGRRDMLRVLGAGAAALALPNGPLFAQSRKDTLVLGLDFSYTLNLDPARALNFTGPETVSAAYETLLTFSAGDYINLKPLLATAWKRTPDGKGWRLTLRDGVKFASGNVMTADDVKFSIDRVINLKDQPSQYLTNLARIEVIDPKTVDLILKDPAAPILTILTGPQLFDRGQENSGSIGRHVSRRRKDKDKASAALNQESAGTGPYKMTKWERQRADPARRQPELLARQAAVPADRHTGIWTRAAHSCWRCATATSSAAFNLTPEQVESLKSSKDVHIVCTRASISCTWR